MSKWGMWNLGLGTLFLLLVTCPFNFVMLIFILCGLWPFGKGDCW
jgi:hypothetical protein